MLTIKRKVEMNLPQLIEWGFRNNIENESYKTNDAEGYELYFDAYGTPRFSSFVNKHDTFTVEIEEEITEDTVLPKVLEIADDGCTGYATLHERTAINEVVRRSSTAFYYLNEDLTLTLMWKNRKLVE